VDLVAERATAHAVARSAADVAGVDVGSAALLVGQRADGAVSAGNIRVVHGAHLRDNESVSEDTRTEALEQPEYCNVCENFPCLGNHPPGEVEPDVITEALDLYNRTAQALWDNLRSFVPEPGYVPIYFSPLRNSLVIREGFEAEKRAADERDRREWTESIRRRLGLVAEVHRCRAWHTTDGWLWWCLRPGCPSSGGFGRAKLSFDGASRQAFAHARSFVPQPPDETPVTGLDLMVMWIRVDQARAEQDAFAAALPGRMAAVAEEINSEFGGWLPEGVRFEWK
jgi:hypothetical protein